MFPNKPNRDVEAQIDPVFPQPFIRANAQNRVVSSYELENEFIKKQI